MGGHQKVTPPHGGHEIVDVLGTNYNNLWAQTTIIYVSNLEKFSASPRLAYTTFHILSSYRPQCLGHY